MEMLIEFHKIVDDIENIEAKINNEDNSLLLLTSLSRFFEHLNKIFMVKKIIFLWMKSR